MATTSFRFETDAASEEPMSAIACPDCREFLTVHMPDPGLPERLLATCEACKRWYVMDPAAGTMVLVADAPPRPRRAKRARPTQDPKRARIG
ncbi:MAG: hypothetical protein P4L84_30070 [Isosphaeraceae bacterium]|nr:hypothetical protein [Isosphaeraceae bacterium]